MKQYTRRQPKTHSLSRTVADPMAALARAYDFILTWPAPTTATVTLEPAQTPESTPTPQPEPIQDAHE